MPIELLDVAGLVPGAHQGRGLGNKFLDDLRHADALIHVVDCSGTTDAEGMLAIYWILWSGFVWAIELMNLLRREEYERLRSIGRHSMASIRNRALDRR